MHNVPNTHMYVRMSTRMQADTQKHTSRHTNTDSSTLSTRGLCVRGREMPCQHTPHGSLEGREKLNSIKKGACDEKCMEGRGGQ